MITSTGKVQQYILNSHITENYSGIRTMSNNKNQPFETTHGMTHHLTLLYKRNRKLCPSNCILLYRHFPSKLKET